MTEWVDLFQSLDLALLTGNLVAELVDPGTMGCYRKLKETLVARDLPGEPSQFLGLHSSTWTNLAIHANQQQLVPHRDGLSSHLGLDQLFPFGPFRRCRVSLPHLGVSVELNPLDFGLLHGAAIWHHMYVWRGSGRFVVVPFADRHLFPFARVRRPTNPQPLLGANWTELRRRHKAKKLGTFV